MKIKERMKAFSRSRKGFGVAGIVAGLPMLGLGIVVLGAPALMGVAILNTLVGYGLVTGGIASVILL